MGQGEFLGRRDHTTGSCEVGRPGRDAQKVWRRGRILTGGNWEREGSWVENCSYRTEEIPGLKGCEVTGKIPPEGDWGWGAGSIVRRQAAWDLGLNPQVL